MTSAPAGTPANGAAAPGVRLEVVTADHWPLIQRWLARPDIIRWWGPRATREAEVLLALSSTAALCRLIAVDGDSAAVGYAHALDAALLGPLPQGVPPGAWAVDLFVAAPEQRGRGVGQRALELMRDEVLGATLALGLCLRISVGNEKAVRACEKAGFRWRGIVRDPVLGPGWLMLAERAPTGGRSLKP